ncbi:MAG: glycosyltransferase [Patescibacteria group bacterium]
MEKQDRKIKVVIVINDFTAAGAQKLIVDVLNHADRQKFDYSLITLITFEGKKTFYDLIPQDIKIKKLSWKGIKDIKGWLSLFRTLRKIHPDVVVSHLFFSNTVTRIIKLFLGFKIITVEHNTYTKKTRFEIFIDKWLSFVTYKIVAVSETVKEFTAKQENISESKFEVIQNGIDIQKINETIKPYNKSAIKKELGFKDSDRLIINVGRLTTQKNQKLLIEGFDLFVKEYIDYKLLILGDGTLRETLSKRIVDLGLNGKVFMMGSQMDIFRYYIASDFFISTSDIEGFGIAHAEALACGLPVLSTRTAGPDRMISEGKNGYFIDNRTPEGVRDVLVKMDGSYLKIVEMGQCAIETASHYDIGITAKRYEALIAKAATGL